MITGQRKLISYRLGHSIVFKALARLEMLKVFFDTISPADAKLLAEIVTDDGETLLFGAAQGGCS